MAHPCINCGGECYCHGDIDDVIVSKTPGNCEGCGCDDQEGDWDDDDYWDDEENEFQPCPRCDGHLACEDFGCAYKLGLGHMVEQDPSNDIL